NPDISYAQSGYFKDILETDDDKFHLTFGSEAGQDEYYILYSYFLKLTNVGQNLELRRQKLFQIYQDLNQIFGLLNNGGTFFGHQYRRLNGYCEYGVYQYKQFKEFFDN